MYNLCARDKYELIRFCDQKIKLQGHTEMKYGEEDTSGILKVSGLEVLITDGLSSEAIYLAIVCHQRPSSFHEFHNPYDAYDCTGAFTAVLPNYYLY